MTYLADATALVALLALFCGVLVIGGIIAAVLDRKAAREARRWNRLL